MVNLTNHPAQDNFGAWSPDGQQLLFTSDRDGTVTIYAISVQGGEPRALTELESANGRPDWSPDGRKIAFMSDRDEGDVEIYVMDADGGNTTRLTDSPGFDGFPAWSPDGDYLAFISFRRDPNNAKGSIGQLSLLDIPANEVRSLPALDDTNIRSFAWRP